VRKVYGAWRGVVPKVKTQQERNLGHTTVYEPPTKIFKAFASDGTGVASGVCKRDFRHLRLRAKLRTKSHNRISYPRPGDDRLDQKTLL
jgi:hypothetical protein